MFQRLDHIAIVVPDAEEALKTWRDRLGFPELFRETVNAGSTLLVHLDLGNTQLQLVQPLTPSHPLQKWLEQNGAGLHHFCLSVESIAETSRQLIEAGVAPGEPTPHQGTGGKKALFLDRFTTGGVQVELTGE